MADSRSDGSSEAGGRRRGARVFMASVLTVGAFGVMSLFGGMSYASQALVRTGGGALSPL